MEASQSLMELSASTPFASAHDTYHVSPFASPEASLAGNRLLSAPTQAEEQPYYRSWPSGAARRLPECQTDGLPNLNVADYQAPVQFGGLATAGYPNSFYNNWNNPNWNNPNWTNVGWSNSDWNNNDWRDTNFNPPMPMNPVEYTEQTNQDIAAGGSFSSTVSSSYGGQLSAGDAWHTRALGHTAAHPYDTRGHIGLLPAAQWSPESDAYLEETASPVLRWNQPSPSFTSSASSPANMLGATDSEAAHSSSEAAAPGPKKSAKKQRKTSGNRRKLPDKQPHARKLRPRHSPKPTGATQSGSRASASLPKEHKQTGIKIVSKPPTTSQLNQPHDNNELTLVHGPRPKRPAQLRLPGQQPPPQPPTRPVLPEPQPASPALPVPPARLAFLEPPPQNDRKAKDDFLVRNKQAGMKFKDIKDLGGFTEAEATLRGRYRTITKPREARVRKPVWTEQDVSVSFFSPDFP
jgi:hypothetical protein